MIFHRHSLRRLVVQSPQSGQLDEYTHVLARLNASIAFGSAESQRDTVRTEPFLSLPSFFLILQFAGQVGRNWDKEACPTVHQDCRLRLIG
jgi:hypothetical protein